jgi:16S rRNA (adenine1518-N6/adenine1519-N6)-dimethyltransferase
MHGSSHQTFLMYDNSIMFLQAKKSLGQHFLNSKHVLEQIIECAKIEKGEQVLEIGPGTGILTEALLIAGANVTAVEKDDRAIDLLNQKFFTQITTKQLRIIRGDILENTPDDLPKIPFKLVANIPYYITGAILEKFLEHGPGPQKMVLLVQKEVAERIVARDGKESVLSISVKAFGEPHLITKVPRGAFTPAPTVDGAVLAIENISDERFAKGNIDIKRFFQIVKAGFAHKRKYAIRNLEAIIEKEKLEKIWNSNKFDLKIRPEDMTVGEWLKVV